MKVPSRAAGLITFTPKYAMCNLERKIYGEDTAHEELHKTQTWIKTKTCIF